MKKIISSVFFHEIKNSLSSIRFGVEVFNKYEMTNEEKQKSVKDILSTIDNTVRILEEYIQFVKFQFSQKLTYENVNIYTLLEEIQKEVSHLAQEKSINIYIKKSDATIYTNKFWLKRAIYNIIFNAIKYNKAYGSVNIKIEDSTFGTYLSINDTGKGISDKKLRSIFKIFQTIDESKSSVGIGLALAKSVLHSLGGDIHVESSENIGSNFILYIPHRPKELTIKRIMLSMIPASIALFLGISYFPIYPQEMTRNINGGYTVYTLEDGSVLKYSQNSDYQMKAYKNLYNTTYRLTTTINKGSMRLKAIKNKADIYVNKREFNNLGTDFEIIKDKNTKLAVFDGQVQSDALVVDKGQGTIITNKIKVVNLLPPVEHLKIEHSNLSFVASPKSEKYQILIATDKEFRNIESSFFTTKKDIKLHFTKDTLYYVKVFEYDKYGLPSLPAIIKYVSLTHYNKAKKLLNIDLNEAVLELESSVDTIQNYSSLPYDELAKVFFKNKDYSSSLIYIKKAIKINPKREYYYMLFDIYTKLHQENKINKYLDEVLKKYPMDTKFLFYKCKILYNKKSYDKANKILFKILQKNPNFKEANLLMSKILQKLGKKESSLYYERLAK